MKTFIVNLKAEMNYIKITAHSVIVDDGVICLRDGGGGTIAAFPVGEVISVYQEDSIAKAQPAS